MPAKEILNLNRVEIFFSADDHIFLPVFQIDKSVLIHFCHIAGVEPSVFQHFSCSFWIVVVAGHNSRSADGQFSYLTFFHFISLCIHDPCLPAVSRNTDGTYFVNVINAQMYASRSDGLTQAIIGIILVFREILLPSAYETLWYRLGTDVHQPPLIQLIIFQFYLSTVQCQQDILGPRNQQPHNGTFFIGNSL